MGFAEDQVSSYSSGLGARVRCQYSRSVNGQFCATRPRSFLYQLLTSDQPHAICRFSASTFSLNSSCTSLRMSRARWCPSCNICRQPRMYRTPHSEKYTMLPLTTMFVLGPYRQNKLGNPGTVTPR